VTLRGAFRHEEAHNRRQVSVRQTNVVRQFVHSQPSGLEMCERRKKGVRTHCDSLLPDHRTNVMLDIAWSGNVFSLNPASTTGHKAPDRSAGPLIRRDHVRGRSMPHEAHSTRTIPGEVSKKIWFILENHDALRCGRKTTSSSVKLRDLTACSCAISRHFLPGFIPEWMPTCALQFPY
jgi:hypothetical protein